MVSLNVSETTVREDVGEVTICITELSRPDSIQRDIIVNVFTLAGSATGMKFNKYSMKF